jgi:hypothetical protein
MRNVKGFLLVFTLVAILATGVGSVVLGQGAAAGDIVCDSDLILLWYVADRYFGFGGVQNLLAQTSANPSLILDFNRFNRGQFNPLFAGLPADVSLDQESLNIFLATLQMDDATFQNFIASMQPAGVDLSTITNLPPAGIAGEAPECTLLRNQLRRFFAAVAFRDFLTGSNTAAGLNANINANVNTNANVNDNANTNANVNANNNANVNDNTNNTNDNDNGGGDDNGDDDDDDNSGSGGGGGNSGSGGGDDDDDDNSGSGGD